MAKTYLDKLSSLINDLKIGDEIAVPVEARHFFNGAGFYVNGAMCASWSPAGLAFKLPEKEVVELIASGTATSLKYFSNGHVKKGYALFENPDATKTKVWKNYFVKASRQILCKQDKTKR